MILLSLLSRYYGCEGDEMLRRAFDRSAPPSACHMRKSAPRSRPACQRPLYAPAAAAPSRTMLLRLSNLLLFSPPLSRYCVSLSWLSAARIIIGYFRAVKIEDSAI